jgi:hypothetical protein
MLSEPRYNSIQKERRGEMPELPSWATWLKDHRKLRRRWLEEVKTENSRPHQPEQGAGPGQEGTMFAHHPDNLESGDHSQRNHGTGTGVTSGVEVSRSPHQLSLKAVRRRRRRSFQFGSPALHPVRKHGARHD